MIGRRVVVTGLGIVSPVGNTTDSAWQSIREGRSGIQPIQRFDTTPFAVRFGGEVRDFDVTQYLSRKEARKMDPFIHYGIAAAVDALRDSGLTIDSENADRVGVCSTVPGVLDEDGEVIPRIAAFDDVAAALGGSDVTDVSGGMAAKVRALLELESRAHVFGPDSLEAFLAGEPAGTTIEGGHAGMNE